MKTVFIGTINDEKFDNVESYNKRMVELINKGEQVNATSETKTVPEPSEKKCECGNQCGCHNHYASKDEEELMIQNLFPMYKLEFDKETGDIINMEYIGPKLNNIEKSENYLYKTMTTLCQELSARDGAAAKAVLKKVPDAIQIVEDFMDQNYDNIKEAESYLYELKEGIQKAVTEYKNAEQELNKLYSKIQEMKANTSNTQNTISFIAGLNDYYNNVFDTLKQYQTEISNCNCNNSHQSLLKDDEVENVDEEEKYNYSSELLNEIERIIEKLKCK